MNAFTKLLMDRSGGNEEQARSEYMRIRQDQGYAKQFLMDSIPNFDKLNRHEQSAYINKVSPRATVGETIESMGMSFLGGAEGAVAGIADALDSSTKENPFSSWLSKGKAYERTQNPMAKQNLELGDKGRFGSKVTETIGGMIPMVAGAYLNPVVGATIGGLSAYGGAEETARQQGMNPRDIEMYASLQGLAEGGTELIPFGKAGKLLGNNKAGRFISGLLGEQSSAEATQSLAKGALGLKEFGQRMVSENVQENATTVLQREIDKAYAMPIPSIEEALKETTALTSAVTAILGGAGKIGARFSTKPAVESQISSEQNPEQLSPQDIGGVPAVRRPETLFGQQETIFKMGRPQSAVEYSPTAIGDIPQGMINGRVNEQSIPVGYDPIIKAGEADFKNEKNSRLHAGDVIPMGGEFASTPYNAVEIMNVVNTLNQNNVEPTATNIVSVLRNGNVSDVEVGTVQNIIDDMSTKNLANMTQDDFNTALQESINRVTGIQRSGTAPTVDGLRIVDGIINSEAPSSSQSQKGSAIVMGTSIIETMPDLQEKYLHLFDENTGQIKDGANAEEVNRFLDDAKIIAKAEILRERSRQSGMTQEELMRNKEKQLPEELIPMDEESLYKYHKRVMNEVRKSTPSLVQAIKELGGIDTASIHNQGVANINQSEFAGTAVKGAMQWDKVYDMLVNSGLISESPINTHPFDHLKNQLAENKKIRSSEYIESQARKSALLDLEYQEKSIQAQKSGESLESEMLSKIEDCPF